MAVNGFKCLDRAGKSWTWPGNTEMAGNGLEWQEMAGHG